MKILLLCYIIDAIMLFIKRKSLNARIPFVNANASYAT